MFDIFNTKKIQELERHINLLKQENTSLKIDLSVIRDSVKRGQSNLWTLRQSLGFTDERIEHIERRFVKPSKKAK